MKQADFSAAAACSSAEAACFFTAPAALPAKAGKAGRLAAFILSLLGLALAAKLALAPGAGMGAAAAFRLPLLGLLPPAAAFAAAFIAAAVYYRRLRRAEAENAQIRAELAALRQELSRPAAALPALANIPAANAASPANAAAALPAANDSAAALAALLNAAPLPLWLRNGAGQLLFVNKAGKALLRAFAASARARQKQTGGAGEAAAAESQAEDLEPLLPEALRRARAKARAGRENFSARFNLVLKGDRHIFSCRSFYNAGQNCFVDVLEDITEKTNLRREAARIKQGYAETFDRLSTSVAIFDADMRLEFFNDAFAKLWPLETPFLDSHPTHALLLDRLREKGILNERPDWREWKNELFEAYHSLKSQNYLWDLPDGRSLRVVANPHPQGGVTWLFDDLTENYALQARYNSLIHRQSETLDNLSEGVTVFGADGQLRLSNPAFAALWHLPGELALEGTHIEKIKAFCQNANPLSAGAAAPGRAAKAAADKSGGAEKAAVVWAKIAAFITGFADRRDILSGRAELADKSVYDYRLAPLPEGETMLTFVNVTDSVNIARALHERNAALESADRLRNDFIRHVSYELRTPLNSISGFAQSLRAGVYGALTPRQTECLSDITAESAKLRNLVDDILDLGAVDAGIMELHIQPVIIAAVMEQAADRVRGDLAAKQVSLDLRLAPGLSAFEVDEARLRQIFVNLLSNAAAAAPAHSAIRFYAERQANYLAFSVEDEGKGIPKERRPDIFKRFTTYAYEGQKTGAGLGLSIVKSFVELHQGQVLVEDGAKGGTKIICRFPFREGGGAAPDKAAAAKAEAAAAFAALPAPYSARN